MSSLPVTFFYPYADEINQLDRVTLEEPEFWCHKDNSRRRAWILRSYLQLRRGGYDVAVSETLPREGIVVFLPEAEMRSAFFEQYTSAHRNLFVLTIRADITGFRSPLGDADIVQNGCFADERRTFFIPHWPQPGIIPRSADRGVTIENIVFKGRYGSLHRDFRSERWYDYLERRGLNFTIASADPEGRFTSWYDYETADLTLAVRPDFNDRGLYCGKPASKLVNSWLAGVPAVLGPEYAYRELRESELDYIEVTSLDDAMTAVDRLLGDPDRYEAMLERCRERACEFRSEQITERWAEVLFERLPAVARQPSVRWSRRIPLRARRVFNFMTMPPAPFELRKQIGYLVRSAL